MPRPPYQFRLRTLVLVVAVAAVVFEVYVVLRPSKPQMGSVPPRFGQLRVGRLIHDGDWDVAAQVIPDWTNTMNNSPFGFELEVTQTALFPTDPNLVYYPLVYLYGRGTFSFTDAEREALRRHLWPGGGTLFADAGCGSADFDAVIRRFVAELMPNNPLVPIPRDDVLYTTTIGADLSAVRYTKATGGNRDFPHLEGVKIDGHWAIIYSKYGVGCAWENDHDEGCQGYVRNDAAKIGQNVLIYSTLP
jgi:hypothetical protein